MRICDVFFAIPGLILAMAFVAAMRSVSSLTLPVWLGVLLPVLMLSYFLHSHLSKTVLHGVDQVSDQASIAQEERDPFTYSSSWIQYFLIAPKMNRSFLVGLFAFLFFVGWLPAVAWPDFFGASHSTGSGSYTHLTLPTILLV